MDGCFFFRWQKKAGSATYCFGGFIARFDNRPRESQGASFISLLFTVRDNFRGLEVMTSSLALNAVSTKVSQHAIHLSVPFHLHHNYGDVLRSSYIEEGLMHAPRTPQMAAKVKQHCHQPAVLRHLWPWWYALAVLGDSHRWTLSWFLRRLLFGCSGGVMASLLSARQSAYTTGGVRAHFRRQRRARGDRVVTCLRHLASLNHDLYLHLHLRPALCPLPLGALAVPRGISS